jgi:peptidoglycan/LPS O-acetylase OafA/YrhL
MPHPELAQTWSLAVEMHFYLLWSAAVTVVVALVPRRAQAVLAGLALAIVLGVLVTRAQRSLDGQHALLLYPNTPNRLDAPLVGSLAGLAYASGRLAGVLSRLRGHAPAVMAVVGIAGILGVAVSVDPIDPWLYQGGFTGIAVVGALAVLGVAALGPGRLSRMLTWRPLVGLGLVSYSLFLWHMPVFTILQREAPGWSGVERTAVALAATAALTAASYTLVERPSQRLRTRERYHPRHLAPAAAARR